MAPWIHAMHDAFNLRKLCAVSNCNIPKDFVTLDDFRNSDEIKNVRKQMMAGTLPVECKKCNANDKDRLFVNLYKDSFNRTYGHHYDEAISKTSEDGHTTMGVRMYDYRFGNICNFKCRHCEPNSSSLLEHEVAKHNLTFLRRPSIVKDLNVRYQNLEKEITTSIHNGTLEGLHWSGGEPLFSEQHWRIMQEIVKNGNPSIIEVSYITNLSILEYKGINFLNLLDKFKDVYIHASIESGGLAAEYIRDGLNWEEWKKNYKKINDAWRGQENKRIACGITLNSFSLLGLREYLEFLCEENTMLSGVNLHNHSNPNNRHLDVNSLGSYKTQWLTEYKSLVNEYKDRLFKYNYDSLMAAADILEHQPTLDLDSDEIYTLTKSIWASNKVDKIRKGMVAEDVLKSYPFMLEWWHKINDK